MADCSDLNARKRELEEKLAAAEKVQRAVEAEAALDNQTTSGNFRTFSMVDGTKVRIDLEGWYAKAEADNVAMGEDALKEYVRDQFSKNAKPNGSKNENINYAQMDPTDENVNLLLAMAGQKRGKTEFGEELAMPFTSEVANQALIQEVALRGGDVTTHTSPRTRPAAYLISHGFQTDNRSAPGPTDREYTSCDSIKIATLPFVFYEYPHFLLF